MSHIPSDTTSGSLLSRVRDPADRAAWREFDARYGDLILRYIRRCGLRHSDAEDVRQMVMFKLARALPGFHYDPHRGRFRSFLGCVVHNETARHLARPDGRPAEVHTGGEVEPLAVTGSPDERWEQEWMHHHLRLAMSRIRNAHDPRHLEVFERILAGDAIERVAQTFAMSVEAVHKIKQRIRDRLKAFVAEQIREEDQPHA